VTLWPTYLTPLPLQVFVVVVLTMWDAQATAAATAGA
jgi:hypothetical protein